MKLIISYMLLLSVVEARNEGADWNNGYKLKINVQARDIECDIDELCRLYNTHPVKDKLSKDMLKIEIRYWSKIDVKLREMCFERFCEFRTKLDKNKLLVISIGHKDLGLTAVGGGLELLVNPKSGEILAWFRSR